MTTLDRSAPAKAVRTNSPAGSAPARAAPAPVAKGRRIAGRTGMFSRLRLPAFTGLSSRLLMLTGVFTLAVEILIVAPSAAQFHERWLLDRIRAAELASVGVEALPYSQVSDETAQQLLRIGGVTAVRVGEEGVQRLLLRAPELPREPDFIDLRRDNMWSRLVEPWQTLVGHDDRSIRVMARPRYRSGDYIEIVAPAQPLKVELGAFLTNLLLVSLLVSIAAGALLYAALTYLVLNPMGRVTRSIERFTADPEAASTEPPSRRKDEIGRVERELARMQEEVRAALRSRARLAALGEAVAKINHDLRNMLTAAEIASERLASSADPHVAKALPRLERALGRAAALARNTLDYGKSEEPPPSKGRVPLASAVSAAAEDAGLDPAGVRLERHVPPRFAVQADPDQLHRILVNLMRNAREAIEGQPGRQPAHVGVVRIAADSEGGVRRILIQDDGPGIPERLAENLFKPFVSGRSSTGVGLGLTIARELAVNHGGDLRLRETGQRGTIFELTLPD